ncbi:heme lyase CcmF/NrfE family subunit [Sulfuriflexus mobilis]|uniref:heme lyase CcmF/NrfE family subunit n=1 Tax=Sulfuriflexus mobilis TaxID=1811807 RepID=UPI000F81D615|nr:heme lyase CcmF/NrfE family subunit [Sulfuriflexus mobilis]
MIPELGHFALILALSMALVQAVVPLVGAARGLSGWIAVARPAARAQLLCLVIAFACLTSAFIGNDFSVLYVTRNSNTDLPLLYRIAAVWGAHEGSLLLWALVLAMWSGAVTVFSRSVPETMVARVLGVMGLVSVGFLLFMLFTSNPFERQFPIPLQGRDLNPLLQDFGLAIHPPMLYMGYVGFSVAFAFAIAALLGGHLDAAWARWSRPWTSIAWVFLTGGIALGSWWAYYELGWGGWWFWDPVENASFMPWLVGTALMHSLAATEKRGTFKAWTVLLAIFAFSLSLLGTFLVRSGVLTSVHAFATDPKRGVFILLFLGVVVGGSLALYAWRAPQIRSTAHFELVSRETGLLLNNVLLVVVAASILLGTLYPLVIDALGIGKISVGPPYFNSVFVPLTIPLALLVGVGALARWKQDSLKSLLWRLRYVFGASLIIGVLFPLLFMSHVLWQAMLGMVLAAWVSLSTLYGLVDRVANKPHPWRALRSVPRGFYGMSLAHLGIAVFTVGVTLTSLYSDEQDVRLAPGEGYELGGYRFQFDGVKRVNGPNYLANEGQLSVTRNGEQVAVLTPQKRFYGTSTNPMTEAAIDAGLTRDLFVALGEPLGKEGAWSVRLYHKPYIRWIWLGAVFMSLGGLLAATDRRYRLAARRSRDDARVTGSGAGLGATS